MVLVGGEGHPKTGKGREIPPTGKEIDRWGNLGCCLTGVLIWNLSHKKRIQVNFLKFIRIFKYIERDKSFIMACNL